jgi:uncharacterized membrane protein
MKIFYGIVLVFLAIFAISWTFNHIDAWAGVILFGVVVGVSIKYFSKKLKKS